jgi:xanthine/CO dehydrogenase XdhC/CoxF family maturation factor
VFFSLKTQDSVLTTRHLHSLILSFNHSPIVQLKEIRKILERYRQIDFSERKVALATVVRVEGSSYRRAGAKMLISDDGRWEGAISGGCLEGDALRKARQVMLDGRPMVVTYDTMDDDANSLGVGLGCNGIIDVFIEPIAPENPQNGTHSIDLWQTDVTRRRAFVEAKVIRAPDGYNGPMRWRLADESLGNQPFVTQLYADMRQAEASGKPTLNSYAAEAGEVLVFIEPVRPEIELVVFGGGYDVPPLVQMAKALGWHVTVTEDCVAHVAPKRFPGADEVRFIDRHRILEETTVSPRTAAVLMSHGYKYDKAVLEQLLRTEAGYIGMLGPRKRFEKMLADWENEGKAFDETRLAAVHSPIGLDIGAETPDEIALAVLAEIQARFTDCPGTPLRLKQGPIHERGPHPASPQGGGEKAEVGIRSAE